MIGLATCRDSSANYDMMPDFNRDRTATSLIGASDFACPEGFLLNSRRGSIKVLTDQRSTRARARSIAVSQSCGVVPESGWIVSAAPRAFAASRQVIRLEVEDRRAKV